MNLLDILILLAMGYLINSSKILVYIYTIINMFISFVISRIIYIKRKRYHDTFTKNGGKNKLISLELGDGTQIQVCKYTGYSELGFFNPKWVQHMLDVDFNKKYQEYCTFVDNSYDDLAKSYGLTYGQLKRLQDHMQYVTIRIQLQQQELASLVRKRK